VLQPMTVKWFRVVEGMNGVLFRLNPLGWISDVMVSDVKQV